MTSEPGKAYRYEARRYSVCIDPDADLYTTSAPELKCEEWFIVRETPCGFWIDVFKNGPGARFVKNDGRKRYAHRKKMEALDAYIMRKKAYVRHATNTLHRAQDDLALANKFLLNPLVFEAA